MVLLLGLGGCSSGGSDNNTSSSNPATTNPDPSNQPPKAVANATKTSGYEGMTVEFNAKGSEDPDGQIVAYRWYENGATVAQVPYFKKTYTQAGTYKLKLVVTDNDGATAESNELTVTVKASSPTPAPAPAPSVCGGSSAGFNIGRLATGQKTAYYANDDGDLQRGAARSYTRDDANNIVCDNVTHLMWQDDTDAKTVKKTWDEAKTYCANLTLGGYSDWRLPGVDELLSITDLGRVDPAIDPTFRNVVSTDYWSSTTGAGRASDAWGVYFNNGGDDVWGVKTDTWYVRCVRDN